MRKRQVMCSIEDSLAKRGMTMEDLKPYIEAQEERIRQYKLEQRKRRHLLRQTRKEEGLTQTEVAKRMGVSQKRVCELEGGDIERTQLSTLRRYTEALGGTLSLTINLHGKERTVTIA